MPKVQWKLAAICAAVVLAACGGGGDDRPVPFSQVVSFGDSLSDVGTYKVGTVAAVGGGKWTVNAPTARNWTELVASAAGVSAPCAAQTGMQPNVPGLTGAAVVNVAGCRNYAQGSARVTSPFGPNAVAFQQAPFNQVNIGLMAVPVATQMSTHLANTGGSYSGLELVTVMAGGNDLLIQMNGIERAAAGGATAVGAAIAAGWSEQTQAIVSGGGSAAVNAALEAAVLNLDVAGATLANLVKSQVVAKGAKYVAVVNLPDVSLTPYALAQQPITRQLINTMVNRFNSQLSAGLNNTAGVVIVDAYTSSRAQAASPATYGLTNVTSPACNPASTANPLQGSSLTCTGASTVAGDVSGYLYADSVHPTPRGYQLLSQGVIDRLRAAGWL